LTKLATVRDLKVISRISTAKYQSKPDNLKTVAQELGVSTILEGAVQKAGDQVRVNVQLIDARAERHLWAKSYDRNLKDILTVESEVAQEIADALQAKLSPSESQALAAIGTRDAEAYDLFLRGEYEFHEAKSSLAAAAFDRADVFYRQALARDPNFAQAAATLAQSRLCRHWYISALRPSELKEVKSIVDQALALAPNSLEPHVALAMFFYLGEGQYENALTEFHHVLELQPNNPLARQYCGFAYRRRGEWARSLAELQRAEEFDPRDAQIAMNLGLSYLALRLWKDAERAELRALAIDPHNTAAAEILLNIGLSATGSVESAQRTFEGFPEDVRLGLGHTVGYGRGSGTVGDIMQFPVYLHVIQRQFTDAFQALDKEAVNDDTEHLHQLAARVVLRVLAGQTEAARRAGEQALPLFEARLRERPEDTPAMIELSWVYVALGRNGDALRVSRQAAELIPIEKDALRGPTFQNGLAQIEARAGAPEEAIKRLRRLLSIPTGYRVSIARLKIDPVWDPIRNRPDFQQLLSHTEQVGPNK
jgi:tetratricopeptide (TPR) repeat protein